MGKGINLALTKSLVDFDELLDKALEAVPGKKLSPVYDPGEDSWRVPGGKYVEIDMRDDENFEVVKPMFWVGWGKKTRETNLD